MSETDVRITDLDLLSFIDSGDFFAVVDTGAINRTKKVEFDSISGQINDPLSGFVVAVSGELQSDVNQLSGYILDVSGKLDETSGHLDRVSGRLNVVSGEVDHISGEFQSDIDAISGYQQTISGRQNEISGDLDTVSGLVNTNEARMMYCIYAEEAGAFTAGHEWSFGGGDQTPAANGIPIVFASKLIGLGLDVERSADGDVTVEVYNNGAASGQTITAAGSATTATSNSLNYTFAAGSKINFKTTAAGGTTQSGRIVAYLRTT